MGPFLVIAGENSGEKHGAGLIRQFKKNHPSSSFFGIGGDRMKAEGVELLYSVNDLSVVGAFELVSHLPRLKRIYTRIKKETKKRKPRASILIDSPDFNLRLAKVLKKLSIPVLYYISPTVWAWRKGRLKTIRKYVDQMMLIFPFEEKLYEENGIKAVYVGHPLLERLNIPIQRECFFAKHGIARDKRIICLMPGSRKSEIDYHMPVLTEVLERLTEKFSVQFILVLAENLNEDIIKHHFKGCLGQVHILKEDRYECMAYSDLILASCGTANLEAALLETPFITFYKIMSLSYNLGLPLVKTRTYSIVNILAGRHIVPELIQKQFTAEKLFTEAAKILESDNLRNEMIEQFRKIKDILGSKKASENAAVELEKLIGIRLQ